MDEKKTLTIDAREEAVKLFNGTWDLIDLGDKRTAEQDAEMLTKAYASRYLWGLVGTPTNFARGEWQISHVCSLLGYGDLAMEHALLCLDLTEKNSLGAFDLAFAYEALARAFSAGEQYQLAAANVKNGLKAAETIEAAEDKDYVIGELKGINIGEYNV